MGIKAQRIVRRGRKAPYFVGECYRCNRQIVSGEANVEIWFSGRLRLMHRGCADQLGPPGAGS